VLASLIDISQSLGYPALFVFVMVESMGVPVPGETAVILAGLAANEGRLSIVLVIACAALAAIVGDNIGFEIGRRGGRSLLERPGRFAAERRRVLEIGDPFFARHGAKAVFLGRWVAGLRVWAAWLAGASEMRRSTFMLWNAAGGIGWATTVALAAFYGGKAAEHAFSKIGLYGAILAVVIVLGLLFAYRRRSRPG
jgi:membrane protein DedA with SNARE-associated domain